MDDFVKNQMNFADFSEQAEKLLEEKNIPTEFWVFLQDAALEQYNNDPKLYGESYIYLKQLVYFFRSSFRDYEERLNEQANFFVLCRSFLSRFSLRNFRRFLLRTN